MKHVTAIGAPTRFWMICVTSMIRSRWAIRAEMRSPTLTVLAALAVLSFSETRPERHRSVAAERDGVSRTAHIHTSIRIVSMDAIVTRGCGKIRARRRPSFVGCPR